MAEIVLFHHAQGLTPGVLAFADELRRAGHVVHTPDLYDGYIAPSLDDGVAKAGSIGFDNILERGVRAADGLSEDVVYAGFSLGVMPAQKLAQTRPGARGALLFESCVPTSEFGPGWPANSGDPSRTETRCRLWWVAIPASEASSGRDWSASATSKP